MLLSVIVPVYNTEKYLHRCIDSILAQTFTDFELLLIDDGSTDSSGAICDEYATKDARIRVFHKENGGVSSARNLGLDNAKGEWVAFVDSDDWVKSDYLFSMFKCTDADLIISSFEIIDDIEVWFNRIDSKIYIKKEIKTFIEKYIYTAVLCSPWCKLYRRQLIGTLRFNQQLSFYEDTIFVFEYLCNINTVCIIEYYGYMYRRTVEDSLSVKQFTLEHNKKVIREYFRIIKKVEETFGYEGTHAKITNSCTLFRKCLSILTTNRMPLKHQYKYLVDLLNDENIQEILKYKNPQFKCFRRRLFDFLALYKLYLLLLLHIRCSKDFLY